MRGQSIGRGEQREREQNTQKFHAVTFAFPKYCEIGLGPFLVSVFGLHERESAFAVFRRGKTRNRNGPRSGAPAGPGLNRGGLGRGRIDSSPGLALMDW